MERENHLRQLKAEKAAKEAAHEAALKAKKDKKAEKKKRKESAHDEKSGRSQSFNEDVVKEKKKSN